MHEDHAARAHIDVERLYRFVKDLEGPRNVFTTPKALDAAAQRIGCDMRDAGMQVRETVFRLDGSDFDFRIVEGCIGDPALGPAVVLIAHYDTIERSGGANDNAAGVALVLAAGRALAGLPSPPHVRIVAVPQEESCNPALKGREIESAKRLGIVDDTLTCTQWQYRKAGEAIRKRVTELFESGADQGAAYAQALGEYESKLGPVAENLRTHVRELSRIYATITATNSIGLRSRIGSSRWLDAFLSEGGKVRVAVAVDEPGIYYDTPGTQGLVPGADFKDMRQGYLLDAEARVGNFAALLSIRGSAPFAGRLASILERGQIRMPYGWFDLPLDFAGVASTIPKALGSDHAPFWQAGLPAIFLFDMSLGRDPWNHTAADTIDRMDFDALGKLAHALFLFVGEAQ